jgi:hypothetical protein
MVDDAHLLDDPSAAPLQHRQRPTGVRDRHPAGGRGGPDAVTALWKYGYANRFDVKRPPPGLGLSSVIGPRNDKGSTAGMNRR